jgi:hypothetical protein
MIDDDYGAVGGMRISRGNRSTRRKPAPVPLCPAQIPHDLTWDRTRAAAVGSQQLTATVYSNSQRHRTKRSKDEEEKLSAFSVLYFMSYKNDMWRKEKGYRDIRADVTFLFLIYIYIAFLENSYVSRFRLFSTSGVTILFRLKDAKRKFHHRHINFKCINLMCCVMFLNKYHPIIIAT